MANFHCSSKIAEFLLLNCHERLEYTVSSRLACIVSRIFWVFVFGLVFAAVGFLDSSVSSSMLNFFRTLFCLIESERLWFEYPSIVCVPDYRFDVGSHYSSVACLRLVLFALVVVPCESCTFFIATCSKPTQLIGCFFLYQREKIFR